MSFGQREAGGGSRIWHRNESGDQRSIQLNTDPSRRARPPVSGGAGSTAVARRRWVPTRYEVTSGETLGLQTPRAARRRGSQRSPAARSAGRSPSHSSSLEAAPRWLLRRRAAAPACGRWRCPTPLRRCGPRRTPPHHPVQPRHCLRRLVREPPLRDRLAVYWMPEHR